MSAKQRREGKNYGAATMPGRQRAALRAHRIFLPRLSLTGGSRNRVLALVLQCNASGPETTPDFEHLLSNYNFNIFNAQSIYTDNVRFVVDPITDSDSVSTESNGARVDLVVSMSSRS